MTELEFQQLPNRRIKFVTYTGRTIVGGNITEHEDGTMKHYIQTDFQNDRDLTKEEKIKKGILIPIKPEIIEEAIVLQ
jgi:hypothetical protein